MSVRLACPQCKHAFAPPTTAPGSEFACPSCGKTVKIAVAKQPNPAATIAASQVTPKQSHAPALPTAKPLPKSRPVASDSVQSLPRAKAADPQEILPLVKPADVQDNIPKAKPLPAKKALPPITVAKVASQGSVQDLPVAPLVAAVPAFNAPIPSNPAAIPVGEIIPQDPTSSGGVGFDFGGGASASSGASTIRRRPKRGLPIPLIAGIGGGALLLIVALVFVLSRPETPSSALGGGENNETTANANPDGTPIGNSATTTPATTPATVPVVSVPTVDLDSVQREEIWGRLQHSIVRIETDGPNGKKSALGFLAGGAGWIVTNHHVIDRATKVTVTTSLNEIIESTGIIDTAPSADLAVIAVPPEKMAAGRVVRFARDWKSSKGDLVALSPSNNPTSESIVGYNFRESLSSTKLPPSSKALLREFGMDADNDDLLWLAFDGQVKDNGATGGPLVNEQGHVIGVFTVLSPSSTSGYAIPVSAVAELIDAATNDITPFGDNEIASNTDPSQPDRGEPDPSQPDPSQPDRGEPDRGEPDEGMDPDPNKFGPKEPDPNEPDPNNPFLQNVSPEWSAADIELVFNEGKEFQWDPVTVAQYASLQLFAGKVYRAYDADKTNEGTDEDRREAQKAATDSINQLMAVIWKSEDRVKNVNRFAAQEMKKSNIGVLAYGEVLGQGQLGDRSFVLMKLTGEDVHIAIPVSQGVAQMTTGSRWVVLGVPQGQDLTVTGDNNVTAAMIKVYHVIGRKEL